MDRRLSYLFEFIIVLTLFSMFAAFTITTTQNEQIVDITENFTEMIRYKGCITADMYNGTLRKYPTPVKITFIVEKNKVLSLNGDAHNKVFSKDIIESIETTGLYGMKVGDEVQVVVRKNSPTYFDSVVGALTNRQSTTNPVIAVKGGLILNEQYH